MSVGQETPAFEPSATDSTTTDTTSADDPAVTAASDEGIETGADTPEGRQNLRETPLDGIAVNNNDGRADTPGIALGTMTLRPSITQSLGVESDRDGATTTRRTFTQTGLKGSLTSDWSSHRLTVTGEADLVRTLSGIPDDDPAFRLDALLRLDVTSDTTLDLSATYRKGREEATALNAITDADLQAGVDQLGTTAVLTHDFGRLRATIGAEVRRSVYSAAINANGVAVSQTDRDSLSPTFRGRIGYEISPALIPFIEASAERLIHDQSVDRFGYRRDLQTLGLKAGVEIDLGEKLRGELAGGLSTTRFADSRLEDIKALTIDGKATWSPRRGTDVLIGLATDFEPATVAGLSGAVSYGATAEIAQVVTDAMTARLNAGLTWRDFQSAAVADQTVLATGAGLTWGLSRSLDLTADATYEFARQKNGPETSSLRALMGITLKR